MAVYQLLIAIFSVNSLLTAVKGQTSQCPEGKVFKTCGTACPKTCDNLGQAIICTRQCVRGCFCPSGTVENGDGGCVQSSDCPGQTPVLPSSTSVSSSLKVVRTTLLTTTTILQVTTNSSNTNLQTKTGIIAGSTAAAAVILVILILVVLLIVILVRKVNSRLEKGPGSSKLSVGNGNST